MKLDTSFVDNSNTITLIRTQADVGLVLEAGPDGVSCWVNVGPKTPGFIDLLAGHDARKIFPWGTAEEQIRWWVEASAQTCYDKLLKSNPELKLQSYEWSL